jgi:hypothetical protein
MLPKKTDDGWGLGTLLYLILYNHKGNIPLFSGSERIALKKESV